MFTTLKVSIRPTCMRTFWGFAPLLTLGALSLAACSANERGPKGGDGYASGGNAGKAGRPAVAGTTSRGGEAGDTNATGGTGMGPSEGGEGGDGSVAPPTPVSCPTPRAEPVPARRAITTGESGSKPGETAQFIRLTKAKLFDDFVTQSCGISGCHGAGANPPHPNAKSPNAFSLTLDTFGDRSDLGSIALERILSSDPLKVMPPGSGDGSKRAADDPVRVLGERLVEWEKRGFPERFELRIDREEPAAEAPRDPYLVSPDVGANLTNIGTCVPSAALMASTADLLSEMEELDAMFEDIETTADLPDTLVETDLTSLDSVALAERGVFSYAPTYPLFSDNAGKMRYVRVPVGETIHYNPETKDFDIPDNTRFYKTFVRKVTDRDGNVGFRKMETRLIVVRQDEKLANGSYRIRALRASYAWDKDEEMAHRVKDPLRNGEPAADRLCPVIVDETVTRDPEQNPISDEISENCQYMTQEEMDDPSSGKVRHYAIPSTQRCDQCHMGSNNHSYILGFTPWQVDRRPPGEGGIYEEPQEDELSQLARLIEYGVISGIEPGEAKLEESQGNRTPRNEHELTAQGYMLGNCAFCHNPMGFPVVENPILKDFDMFPSEVGGIFRFPLDKVSPRAKVGKAQLAAYPYISPAFGDFAVPYSKASKQKQYIIPAPTLDYRDQPQEYSSLNLDDQTNGVFRFLGPWRSLIWRNVYTPFTYSEDETIFIHMPRNVPGYDCRAQKIMANWMLSIPAVGTPNVATDPPREVTPEDSRYKTADYAATTRVSAFAHSVTGGHCPTDDDIIDPEVVLSKREFQTNRKTRQAPRDDGILNSPKLVPDYQELLTLPSNSDGVPDHAHWVPVDTTDAPGKWVPRRQNWKDVLVNRTVEVSEKLSHIIDDLQNTRLTPEQRAFSLAPLPMGGWHPDCQSERAVASSPTVEELLEEPTEPSRRWLFPYAAVYEKPSALLPGDRVHFQSRGETVFRQICQNCHGREADSRSPLAATILELTGGETRVANFVDGLFGPRSAPGAFGHGEFLIDRGATPEEWQVRYMLFMGLGGTQAVLPREVLSLVASAPFYQTSVSAPGTAETKDANMLESAADLCIAVIASSRKLDGSSGRPLLAVGSPFAVGTGHFELWESLCNFNNQESPMVHVFTPDGSSTLSPVFRAKDDGGNWVYPTDHPVGNQRGEIEIGIQPGNHFPWCVQDESEKPGIGLTRKLGIPDDRAPICPPAMFAKVLGSQLYQVAILGSNLLIVEAQAFGNQEFLRRWARRGAMNAGIAAFYYLQGLTRGDIAPSPAFDFCRQ